MQDLLTIISSSSNPANALRVLRRLAVVAPDDTRLAQASAAAKALAREMRLDIANNEAAFCDKHHIDWYIGDAMAQLVEGEADEVKRAQYREIKDAFAAFYDDDGSGDPWRLMATLDFLELSPDEFNAAKRIADQMGSMLPDLRSLLNDARRLAGQLPAAGIVLAPMLSFLEAAGDAHELSRCHLRPAWADLQNPPDSDDHSRASAPSMRGG